MSHDVTEKQVVLVSICAKDRESEIQIRKCLFRRQKMPTQRRKLQKHKIESVTDYAAIADRNVGALRENAALRTQQRFW